MEVYYYSLFLELLNIANQQQDKWTIHLTSGYFNFTDKYKAVILKTRAFFRFLTASPEVRGVSDINIGEIDL